MISVLQALNKFFLGLVQRFYQSAESFHLLEVSTGLGNLLFKLFSCRCQLRLRAVDLIALALYLSLQVDYLDFILILPLLSFDLFGLTPVNSLQETLNLSFGLP